MPAVELEREPAAERQPDHVRPSQAECRDEGGEAVGEVGEAKRFGRIGGAADSRAHPMPPP